uniref:Protein-serine/threonine phosphatase n=1 Tax=Panagrellus redivivus TaxID=6233 RepID=A0A7E4VGZ3_PANRE
MTDSDDDFQLSAEAKKALDEFLAEQKQVEGADVITENWQLSQFWYTDETSQKLAQECVVAAIACKSDDTYLPQIACVSCPSVMEKLVELPVSHNCEIYI